MRLRSVLTLSALLLAVGVPAAGFAHAESGAGAIGLSLDPGQSDVPTDGKTTVVAVATGDSGGVGSFEAQVRLSDPSVATITNVSVLGNATFEQTEIREDGQRATASAVGLNRTATEARLFSVTIRGEQPGEVTVTLTTSSIGDTAGREYDASNANATMSLTVRETNTATATVATPTETTRTETSSVGNGSSNGLPLLPIGVALLAIVAGIGAYVYTQ